MSIQHQRKDLAMAKGESARSVGRNTVSGQQLMSIIERVEQVREQKKQLAEDEKLIFAEAKHNGFSPARIRDVLKRRAAKPADVEEAEAELDMYLHAIGMATEAPLFRSVGMMNVDTAAREQVIEAFKLLVPQQGEIIIKIGSQPVRLFRDEKGEAHAVDFTEAPAQAAAPRTSAGVPQRPAREVPDCDEAGAYEMGRQAYHDNQPVTSNPFPWDDKRRERFDAGWRAASGSDGMGPET